MKKILSLLMAIASLTMANAANAAVDDKTFFSGAHLGMTIDECNAFYTGSYGSGGEEIADGGILEHSGAPAGERQIDFRTRSVPQRRVYVFFRKSDGKVVSVTYWKLGENETFSKGELSYFLKLNSGHGRLVTRTIGPKETLGTEFEITTAAQLELEKANN